MFSLAQHQRTASQLLEITDCLGLFYEAGTGKTMCVLDWLYRHPEWNGKVLIVAPAAVVPMWHRAISNMRMFEGYSEDRIADMERDGAIRVTSFGKLYTTTTMKTTGGRFHRSRTLRPDIDRAWEVVVIDESHCIGSHSSVQTKMCMRLARQSSHRVIMSGTPISGGAGQKGYSKLYTQLLFLDDGAWDGAVTWTAWCKRYVTRYDYYNNPTMFDVEALDAKMKAYGIVARLSDCYDMPSQIEIPVPLEMPSSAMKVYSKIRTGHIDDLGYPIDYSTSGSFFVKMLEATAGFVKDDLDEVHALDTARTDALEQILAGTDDKVVVFCHFTYSVDVAARVCSALGETVVFDGRSGGPTWKEFQDGSARFLVTQYQAGGVGLDLFASHTTVFYEPTMSALLLEQAKARTYRKGQTERCLYYHLYHPGLVDERIMSNVREGVSISTRVLQDWARELIAPAEKGLTAAESAADVDTIEVDAVAPATAADGAEHAQDGKDDRDDGEGR